MPARPSASSRPRPQRGLAAVLVLCSLLAGLLAAVGPSGPALAAPPVIDLGTAQTFSALSSSSVTSSEYSVLPQNVGVSPGTALPIDGTVRIFGSIYAGEAAEAVQANTDAVAAYHQVAALTPTGTLTGDIGGRTITPGIYYANAALEMSTSITFDAQNDPDAFFVFQINAALDTAANSRMLLLNGAQPSHIFWQSVGAATLGAASTFLGTVLSNAAISTGSGTFLTGRILAINGAITAPNLQMVVDFLDPHDDSAVTTQATAVSLDVLANDGATAFGSALFTRSAHRDGDVLVEFPHLVGDATGPVPASPHFGSVTCVDTGDARGVCTYTPVAGFVGVDGFDYGLSQGLLHWNVHVTVTVAAVNHAPTARADRIVATVGGPAVAFSSLANDTDPDGDPLSLTARDALPAAAGVIRCTPDCSYTPPVTGAAGVFSISYSTADRAEPLSADTLSATSTITFFLDPAPLTVSRFFSVAPARVATSSDWSPPTPSLTAVALCTGGRPSTSLAWQRIAGATGVELERREAGSTTWVSVASLPSSATAFSDSRVGEGRDYQWRLRPRLERWTSATSELTAATRQAAAISAVGC